MVTWGDAHHGGDSSAVASQLVDVVDIFPATVAYCALKVPRFQSMWKRRAGGWLGGHLG